MSKNPKSKDTGLLYFGHVRTPEQLAQMEELAAKNICFMCPEHIKDFYTKKKGFIAEGKHSFLVKNSYPYENTQHHLLIIPKQHITSLQDIGQEFWVEALSFLKQQEKALKVKGAAIAMRFGDPVLTGASVHHMHLHLIVPRPDIKPDEKPVKFRMSHKGL